MKTNSVDRTDTQLWLAHLLVYLSERGKKAQRSGLSTVVCHNSDEQLCAVWDDQFGRTRNQIM